MFEAKFPSKCSACWKEIVPGMRIEANGTYVKADKIVKGYRHADCDAPFAGAVDEDYRERWATPSQRERHQRFIREEAERQHEKWQSEEYARAMLALMDEHNEGFGHMDGTGAGCLMCAKGHRGEVYSAPDGGWVHPDIRDGNDFGRYEHQQELRAYEAEMNWENEMEARYS